MTPVSLVRYFCFHKRVRFRYQDTKFVGHAAQGTTLVDASVNIVTPCRPRREIKMTETVTFSEPCVAIHISEEDQQEAKFCFIIFISIKISTTCFDQIIYSSSGVLYKHLTIFHHAC